jgi:hypothetical protein
VTARSQFSHTCATTSVLIALGSAALGACATAEDEPPVTSPDASVPVPTMDSGVRQCAIIDEGTTRACSCATGGSGTQACLGGTYQACRCSVPLPEAGTGSGGTLCKAGFYSGEFTGKYKPGAFGGGLIDNFFFEVDIAGVGTAGFPALSFTLEAEKTGGGEFQSFRVKNGCMIGNAQAVGTNNPFVARIDGELDCRTGAFSGNITGRYDLIETGLKFDFTGPLSSQFEAPQSRLKDGIWNVKEPPSLSGTPAGGGGGTWSAIWESDAPPPGEDPCASADLPVADAGSVTPTDAGAATDAGTPSDAGN